ncbi:MAG: hypothetical protein PHC96_06895, partial [Firmicutes bacterium]|nr:hypothetical protein [Bacillota bacterium]
GIEMKRKLLALLIVVLVMSFVVMAEDVLIYEANFSKNDSRDVCWEPMVGDWEMDGGFMINYDTSSVNTNITQELEQSGMYTFIYEYKMAYIETSVSWAPMAGLHFMANDDISDNRGDSYLMWHDSQNIQLYKTTSNTLAELQQVPNYPAIVGDERVVRVEYDTRNGEIKGFIDGELVIHVIDPKPLVDGSFVSLRTSQTAVEFDYLKIWVRK